MRRPDSYEMAWKKQGGRTEGINAQSSSNIVERIIETAKHHFITWMIGTDENYPIREWDRGVEKSQTTLNMLRPCRIIQSCRQTHSWKANTITTLCRPPPWDGEWLYLKDLTKDPHGDFMGWRDSVWAPQRKTTDATRDGSQQQEQSGYQTQWCYFHREDTD